MTSIRRGLTVRLLVWLGLLLLAAGVALFLGIRGALVRQFDATLHARAAMLQSGTKWDGAKVDVDFTPEAMPWYRPGASAEYFEVSRAESSGAPRMVIARSPSLGLDGWAEQGLLDEGVCDRTLPDGRRGRLEVRCFRPLPEEDLDQPGKEVLREQATRSTPLLRLVVGVGRTDLDAALRVIWLGFAGAAVALGIGLVLSIRAALASGLRSLESLSAQVVGIHADALSTRLVETGLPDELRPIHGRLNELLERLEGAFARERRFTSAAAHELRTPVAELRALLEVSLSRGRSAEELRTTLASALEVTLGLEDLVRALLALARRTGAEEGPGVQPTDPMPVLARIAERYDAAARVRGGSVECTGGDGLRVNANRAVLESVLDNVIANAVEYASPKARVVCRVQEGGDAGTVVIEVSNPSEGTRPADIERFFEPFWRRSESRSERRHLGMGLVVARALAGSMGGRLTAHVGSDGLVRVRLTLRRSV